MLHAGPPIILATRRVVHPLCLRRRLPPHTEVQPDLPCPRPEAMSTAGISQNTSGALHWPKLLDPAWSACHGAKANAHALSTAASSRTLSPLTKRDRFLPSPSSSTRICLPSLHTLQSYFPSLTPLELELHVAGSLFKPLPGPALPCHDPLAGCGRLVLARSDLGACAKPPTQPLRQATPPPPSRCSFSPRS
jgi:hypothetical protein